ncbi:hypothetical protein VP01_4053g2 [Puccinia sorghi]|uniref:Uncharacterized protein n=1 Tax=Puccinia sorghi TaxID=27349 RepID=A0A0L6USG9_9BASI|nr:hypothetical protein VP01_4053g2 [Puccinia sorghi]
MTEALRTGATVPLEALVTAAKQALADRLRLCSRLRPAYSMSSFAQKGPNSAQDKFPSGNLSPREEHCHRHKVKSFTWPNLKEIGSGSRLNTRVDCRPIAGLSLPKDKSLSFTLGINPESIRPINHHGTTSGMLSTAATNNQNNVWLF